MINSVASRRPCGFALARAAWMVRATIATHTTAAPAAIHQKSAAICRAPRPAGSRADCGPAQATVVRAAAMAAQAHAPAPGYEPRARLKPLMTSRDPVARPPG